MTQGKALDGDCNAFANPIPAPAMIFVISFRSVMPLALPRLGPSAILCLPAMNKKLNVHFCPSNLANVVKYEWQRAWVDIDACTSGAWSLTNVMCLMCAGIVILFISSVTALGSATVDDS